MKLKLTLFVAITFLLRSVCFSQNPLIKYLPDDASSVMHLDIKRIGSKIPGETFRQSFIYRGMMQNPEMPLNSLLADPSKLGIDLSAGLFIAIKNDMNSEDEKPSPIVHIFGKLQNAEAFTANIKQLITKEGESAIETFGTDKIITGKGMAFGWNNNIFVMTSGYSSDMKKKLLDAYRSDDTSILKSLNDIMYSIKKNQRELCFELLAPKSQNSFSTNLQFIDAMNTEADIAIWGNGTFSQMGKMTEKFFPMKDLITKMQAFTGKNKIAFVNFENGKIVTQSRSYPADAIADIYKKYPTPSQNSDLIRRLPPGKLIGLMNMSYNPDMAAEMMKQTGLLDMIDSIKQKIPFDLSLTQGVFKSNAMIAFLKTNTPAEDDNAESKLKGFEVIAAIPIADKIKFEKLRSVLLPVWDSLKIKKEAMFKKGPAPFLKYNDEMLVLSLSMETATAFLNNTAGAQTPEWLQAYSKYPMLMNLNFKQLMDILLSLAKNKNDGEGGPQGKMGVIGNVLTTFDQLTMYGGLYENGSISSTMELKFANQNDNALKQLFDMLNSMMETKNGHDDESYNENNTTIDSVTTVTIEEIKKEDEKEPPPPPPPPPPVKPKTGKTKVPIKKD